MTKKYPLSSFGKLIRGLRLENSETQGAMATRLGVSVAYISQIERGGRDLTPMLYNRIVHEYALDAEKRKQFEKVWREG